MKFVTIMLQHVTYLVGLEVEGLLKNNAYNCRLESSETEIFLQAILPEH